MRAHPAKALALALALAACGGEDDGERLCNGAGGDNRLEGSYCEDVEMRFSEVRLLSQASGGAQFLRIEYVRPVGTGLEKTLAVLFDPGQLDVQLGQRLPFLTAGGSVRRVLLEGAVTLTPELEDTSAVTLDQYTGVVGDPMAGQVDLSFKNGRKLTAYFSGTLADAAPGTE
jgi:hypothetical protein